MASGLLRFFLYSRSGTYRQSEGKANELKKIHSGIGLSACFKMRTPPDISGKC